MTQKRYELLTDDTITGPNNKTLYRIRALVPIGSIAKPGDLGGYIESEENLAQDGEAWVAPKAIVCGKYTRLLGGTFWGGTFNGGTFRGGTFCGGTFWNGTFKGGTFWGGTFKGGTFWGGTFYGGQFRDGKFRGGTFYDGIFSGGNFRGGTFHYGNFRGGTFRGGVFEGGIFRGGDFRDGFFRGGEFCSGIFKGGVFWSGYFAGDIFRNGIYYGGKFWSGTFDFAITAQRSDGYVFTVNPTDRGAKIAAGCRYFTFAEAEEYWQRTRAGTPLGEETFAILAHLRRMCEIHGLKLAE